MGIWLPPNGGIGRRQTNLTATDRDGTSITSGGSAHTKGAYSAGQLIASLDEDTYALTVIGTDIFVSAGDSSFLLDIGVGASGSERDLIQNLDMWGAGSLVNSGVKCYTFPVFIRQGQRVAARAQALAVSDVGQIAVIAHFSPQGMPMEVPTLWESLGVNAAASDGTSVTPASGSFGSWTTILDPITKDYKWWHVGYGALNDTSIATGGQVLIELGIGDTSAAVTTIGTWKFTQSIAEEISGPNPEFPVYYPVNADTTNGVFARIASHETEARSIIVYAAE